LEKKKENLEDEFTATAWGSQRGRHAVNVVVMFRVYFQGGRLGLR
jgi:hypothetical protein